MGELGAGRPIWSGLVGVHQGSVHQTGFMIGPRTIATAVHGLDRRRAISIHRVGDAADAHTGPANVRYWDRKRDLCLLTVEHAHDFWFVPSPHDPRLSAAYLIVSCVDRRAETTKVTNEGLVDDRSIESIKLSAGQIQRGYSGAPVLDLVDGQLVGMVRVTRDRHVALGGHAVPGAELRRVRSALDLDRYDRGMQARHVARGLSWPPRRPVRGSTFRQHPELVGRERQLALLEADHPVPHRRVAGPPSVGKSVLTSVWAQLPRRATGDTAYVDAAQAPPPPIRHPVVQTVLAVLGVTVPLDPFTSRTEEQTLALACWTIMGDLRDGQLVVDLQQHPVDADADADLAALATAADQVDAAVVAVGRAFDSAAAYAAASTVVDVGPLTRAAATDLVVRTTSGRVPREQVREALDLVEETRLVPGAIIDACASGDDALAIAVAIDDRAVPPPAARTATPSEPTTSPAPTAREAVSPAGAAVESAPEGATGLDARAAVDAVVLRSAQDPLGVRVTAEEHAAVEPGSFAWDAIELDAWPGREPFAFTAPHLSPAEARAMHEIAYRVAQRAWSAERVGQLHERIVDLERQDRHAPSLQRTLPLLRSLIRSGDLRSARRTFAEAGGQRAVDAILRRTDRSVGSSDAHALALAWWLGVGADDDVGAAVRAWMRSFADPERRADDPHGRFVLHDVLRAIAVRPMGSTDGLRAILGWCLAAVQDERRLLSDPGTWTTFVSLLGSASELSGDAVLTREFLRPAVRALATHLAVLKALARTGDNRPLLSIVRQDRRLTRLERSAAPVRVPSPLGPALLDWTVEHAPTAGAFITLLATDRALRVSHSAEAPAVPDLPVHRSASSRLAHVKRLYRRWRAGSAHVDAQVVDVEYRLVRAEWSIAGSIVRQARDADEDWDRRPIPVKREALDRITAVRRATLRSLVTRFGDSIDAIEIEARERLQFQSAIAVVQRTSMDFGPIDDVLSRGVAAFASDPRMVALVAAHQRQRRDLAAAAATYADAFVLAGDPLLRMQAAVGACEAVSQAYAVGDCTRDDLETATARVAPYETLSRSAATVCARARLELSGCLPEGLVGLATAASDLRSFTRLAEEMPSVLAAISATVESEDDPLFARFADDFTNPGVLVGLGAMLVRAHELVPDPSLTRLRAAIVLLDGVRIMAGATKNAPSVSFHQGRALFLACAQASDPNPIGWTSARRDVDVACSRLQSAGDTSVGSFRDAVLRHLSDAQDLRRALDRRTT